MALLDSLEIEVENPSENPIEFTADPEPGERPARRRSGRARTPAPAGEPSKTQLTKMTKEVAADLAGLFDLGGTLWEVAGDECCAPILQQQAKPMGDAIAACLARNPKLLARFTDLDVVSMTVLVGAIGKAVKPVGMAIWHNHVKGGGDEYGPAGIDFDQFPAFPAR